MIKLAQILSEIRIVSNKYPLVIELYKKVNDAQYLIGGNIYDDFWKNIVGIYGINDFHIEEDIKELDKEELNLLYQDLKHMQQKYNIE